MSDESHVQIEVHEGMIEASLSDKNILDELVIGAIGEALHDAVKDVQSPRLLVSFEHVEHLSSAALGMLITLNNCIKEADGSLCLAAIDGPILEVFKITKLDRIFQIRESIADARDAVRG